MNDSAANYFTTGCGRCCFQRRFAERPQEPADPANRQCAGGAAAVVYGCEGHSGDQNDHSRFPPRCHSRRKSGFEGGDETAAEFAVTEEFQTRWDASPALKTALEALTPGRQRGYLLHFAAAKQSKTREARIEKCNPLILSGKGLLD